MKKISAAHMLLFITLAVFMISGLLLSVISSAVHVPVWVSMAVGSIVIFIPGILYCLVKKLPLTQAAGFKKTRPVNFLMAFIVLVCSYPVIVVLNMLSMFFVENAVQNSVVSLLMTTNLPAMLLLMAVLPALGEEFVFRGLLYHAYRRTSPLAGIILSALFFALMHGNFNQIPYAFFLGIVMALMVEATGSIWISIFMHFMLIGFNAFISWLMKPILFRQLIETITGSQNAASENFSDAFVAMAGSQNAAGVLFIYILMAVFFAAAVFSLIYAVFMINGKPMRCLLHPVQFQSTEQKQPLFDWWMAAFVVLAIMRVFVL